MGLTQNPGLICRNAVSEGVRYIKENPAINALVLGVSGGIDSAVTAALAREVISRADRSILLVGRVLPLYSNAPEEMERAREICQAFCDNHAVVNLEPVYDAMMRIAFEDQPVPVKDYDVNVRMGNIKARTRMVYLYDLARRHNGLVLSTDNYTELLLGFWTLHGDVGDFGFIQELWKTEVYSLAEYMSAYIFDGPGSKALIDCVNAKPTDGLGISDSDIDQILPEWRPSDGSYRDAYKKVDEIFIDYLSGNSEYDENHPVIARHIATEFKRKNPVNLKRAMLLWQYNIH